MGGPLNHPVIFGMMFFYKPASYWGTPIDGTPHYLFPQMFQKTWLCVPGCQELCHTDADWRKECCPTCELRNCNAYLETFCKKTQFPLPSFETVIPTASVIFGGLVTAVKPSWAAKENIHSETYSLLIDRYIQDPVEKDCVFNAVVTMPAVEEKAKWAVQWMSPLTKCNGHASCTGRNGDWAKNHFFEENWWNLCRLRG